MSNFSIKNIKKNQKMKIKIQIKISNFSIKNSKKNSKKN